jgi:putative ABC transport system permease protein
MATDLRVLLRGFVRSPGFTALAVISLALGIGLNTAVFSLINALFWQSIRGVPEPHRVVFGPRVSGVELARLREGATTLEGLAGVARVPVQIVAGELSVSTVVPAVSEDYFPALHVTPRRGRLFDGTLAQPGADTRIAVLDHRFWRDELKGDPGVIGRSVTINGHPFTIAGVAPDGFRGAGPERPPLWVLLSAWPLLIGQPSALTDPAREDLALIGRLRDGRSVDDATAELNLLRQRAADRQAGGEAGGAAASRLRRLTLSAGREHWTAEPSPEKRIEFLLITVVPLVIVAALLWIACSNVANLLLARGVGRRREVAIRLATGASRRRIALLLLGETLLLALAGGVLGVLVGTWTLDIVFATFSQFGSIDVSLDASVLAYTAVVSCLATVLAGLVPALEASRGDVSSVLKAEGTSLTVSVRGARLRAIFLTVQVAFALALLMVAGTFVRALVASHFGTDAARFEHIALAQVSLDPARAGAPAAIWDATRDALVRTPGVRGVTVLSADATTAPALSAIDGRPVPAAPLAVQAIDTGYLQAAGARIVHGRAATAPSAEAPSAAASAFEAPFEAVVNTAAARRIARQGEAVSQAVDRALTLGGVGATSSASSRTGSPRRASIGRRRPRPTRPPSRSSSAPTHPRRRRWRRCGERWPRSSRARRGRWSARGATPTCAGSARSAGSAPCSACSPCSSPAPAWPARWRSMAGSGPARSPSAARWARPPPPCCVSSPRRPPASRASASPSGSRSAGPAPTRFSR